MCEQCTFWQDDGGWSDNLGKHDALCDKLLKSSNQVVAQGNILITLPFALETGWRRSLSLTFGRLGQHSSFYNFFLQLFKVVFRERKGSNPGDMKISKGHSLCGAHGLMICNNLLIEIYDLWKTPTWENLFFVLFVGWAPLFHCHSEVPRFESIWFDSRQIVWFSKCTSTTYTVDGSASLSSSGQKQIIIFTPLGNRNDIHRAEKSNFGQQHISWIGVELERRVQTLWIINANNSIVYVSGLQNSFVHIEQEKNSKKHP